LSPDLRFSGGEQLPKAGLEFAGSLKEARMSRCFARAVVGIAMCAPVAVPRVSAVVNLGSRSGVGQNPPRKATAPLALWPESRNVPVALRPVETYEMIERDNIPTNLFNGAELTRDAHLAGMRSLIQAGGPTRSQYEWVQRWLEDAGHLISVGAAKAAYIEAPSRWPSWRRLSCGSRTCWRRQAS
jgi:hypothetical protein